MQERERQRIGPVGPSRGGGFFEDPFAGSGVVTVSHGPFAEDLPVAGMTISQVRNGFSDRLDIHPQAMALIDGNPVDDTTTLRAGQTLMFVRQAGEKGKPCR